MPIKPCLALTASFACVGAGTAWAQEPVHPYLDPSNKHIILLGATSQTADATISSARRGKPGVDLDLDDLGTDDRYDSWMAEYRYRFNENWGIAVGAYTFEVDGNRTADRDFDYDGVEFKAGVSLDTELEVDTYIIDLMYTAYRGERAELLLGGGLHMFDFSASIRGSVFVGDQQASRESASDDLLAPLPNLRMQGFYAFTPHLAGLATLGWLSADYEDYEGDFRYLHARLHYGFDNGLGLAVGYQYTDVDVSERTSTKTTSFDIEFSGPSVQLTYAF